MAFYCPDGALQQRLEQAIEGLSADGRPQLREQLSVTWLCYGEPPLRQRGAAARDASGFWRAAVRGASWQGTLPRYPASVVKLLYLAAAETWLQRQLIEDSRELRRALADMIRDSSNDATALVVDLLTGTSSGPELPAPAFAQWSRRRQLINNWAAGLNWPEWSGCNACQKTWSDGPYGRERQFYGAELENRNRLSTDLTARLLHAVMGGALVSPAADRRMQELLERNLDPRLRAEDPDNQVDGFLGAGLEAGDLLWSKAGWMSQARHDAAYVEPRQGEPFLLVTFSEGKEAAIDETLLPALCRLLSATAATAS